MSLGFISPRNSKNSNHKHISLIGTDHCNSKRIQFEKDIQMFFFDSLDVFKTNQSLKEALRKNCEFPLTKHVFMRKIT